MKTPTDNPRRPARPRRFSAMQPAIRRRGAEQEADGAFNEANVETAVNAAEAPVIAVAEALPVPVKAAKAKSLKADTSDGAAPPSAAPPEKAGDEARVAKVMSRAGLCSRRDAEAWILAGRVAVNGVVIESPALNVGPADQVMVDGYPIEKPDHTRLFMFHKTRGLVTTARDPEGRPTIYDALPDDLPRLMTVGRLDINTEGLLLLTNDGGLARLLELPATGWLRRYRVRANGRVDQGQLDALAKGVTVEGVDYAGIDAKLDRIQGANLWLTLGLREGKNREVKRVLEHLGLAVTRLIRISFGPFQLGDLAEGAVEEVRTRILRDQLGTALAKQAGLDFGPAEPEVREATPTVPADPRRKTSRSATADRKGRAVPVDRISSVARPRDKDVPAGRSRQRPAGAPSAGARDRDDRPDRGGERPAVRPVRGETRGADARGAEGRFDTRPPRTLRQSDRDREVRREDADPRRDPRGGDRNTRSEGRAVPRRDGPRAPGDRSERPVREGVRKPRAFDERGGADQRREASSRPRTGRFEERRDGRSEGSSRPPSSRFPKGDGAKRDGAPSRGPGGKPPFKGKDGRPDGGNPQRPGGGGRGRPRG